MENSKTLDRFLTQVVDKPQVFFSHNQKIVDSALEMAKHFYDNGKKYYRRSLINKILTEPCFFNS